MTDGWSNPLLAAACARLAEARSEYADLERRYRELAAAGTYEAATQLDQIRPRLDTLVADIATGEHDVAREAELEALVNQLMPIFGTLRGQTERTSEDFCERADVPDDQEEWVPFVLKDREVERLRLTLVQAVGPAEAERLDLSRGFSYVAAVQQHWQSVARDRERLATKHGPGNKIRFGQPSWFQVADRLAKLRAGTVRKENAYAVR